MKDKICKFLTINIKSHLPLMPEPDSGKIFDPDPKSS